MTLLNFKRLYLHSAEGKELKSFSDRIFFSVSVLNGYNEFFFSVLDPLVSSLGIIRFEIFVKCNNYHSHNNIYNSFYWFEPIFFSSFLYINGASGLIDEQNKFSLCFKSSYSANLCGKMRSISIIINAFNRCDYLNIIFPCFVNSNYKLVDYLIYLVNKKKQTLNIISDGIVVFRKVHTYGILGKFFNLFWGYLYPYVSKITQRMTYFHNTCLVYFISKSKVDVEDYKDITIFFKLKKYDIEMLFQGYLGFYYLFGNELPQSYNGISSINIISFGLSQRNRRYESLDREQIDNCNRSLDEIKQKRKQIDVIAISGLTGYYALFILSNYTFKFIKSVLDRKSFVIYSIAFVVINNIVKKALRYININKVTYLIRSYLFLISLLVALFNLPFNTNLLDKSINKSLGNIEQTSKETFLISVERIGFFCFLILYQEVKVFYNK